MSETAPERPGPSSNNVFLRKVGPLPMWGWMAVVLLLAVLFYMYHKSHSSSSGSSTLLANGTSTTAQNSANAAGGVDASLVPQFVNQVYNQETPPAAPNVTVNNTVPASTGNVGAQEPAYGLAGPPSSSYQAITPQEATTLQSSNNLYNTAGRKAQRPFIWNGSAYVPNTNPISSSYQYYAGPLETTEINKKTGG
jgi:hypothetical protein